MVAKKAKKVKEDDRDPVERAPFEQRRGTLKAWDYNSWEASSIFVGGKDGQGGLDAIVKNLSKAKKVGVVQADVTKDALAGKIPQPDAPHVVIVKLKGHDWAPLFASHAESYDTDTFKEISKDAGTKVIWCGHQDTASATGFQLFEKGEQIVHFESVGDGYDEDDEPDDMFSTNFKSKLHKKHWWKSHENEDQTLQALLKEQGAYVPMFMVGPEKGKLDMEAFPEDTLEPAHVERVVLAVYGPASKAKPSAAGKELDEAIVRLDAKGVESALKDGADQKFLPGRKETALAHAVNFALRDPDKGLAILDVLLKHGAKVNDPGNGNVPVWELFDSPQDLSKKLPILMRLIAAGADLNAIATASYHKGSAPLHMLAMNGDLKMVRFLIAHGADPKVKDKSGETPRQSAAGNVKTMLKMIDDEGGKHTGPIVACIDFLEQVEKGKIKPKSLSKDPAPIIEEEKAANAKLRAEIDAVLAEADVKVKSAEEFEKSARKKEETRQKVAAAGSQRAKSPATVKITRIPDRPSRWMDLKRRDTTIEALKARGFETIGEFDVSHFDFLRMVGLLHRERHVYAAVCEMMHDKWVDLVQYYGDGTWLEVTNVKSDPSTWVDVPKRRKVREQKWGATKLADFILNQSPPAGTTVRKLKPNEFAPFFERDYAEEMRFRKRR